MLGAQVTEQDRRKIYLNIKDGAIVKRTPTGEEKYSYVEGRLERIFVKERNFRGEIVTYWYLDIRDDDTNELYSLGFPYASNTFKSIILQMASEDGLRAIRERSTLRIEPYSKNGYDKVQVWGEGVKLDWVTKSLPPVEKKQVGGIVVKDDRERMALICDLANRVKNTLGA